MSLIGAVRLGGWVALGTQWNAVKATDFITWVRDRLAPRLRSGDIVLLDNLRAHKAPRSLTSSHGIEPDGWEVTPLPRIGGAPARAGISVRKGMGRCQTIGGMSVITSTAVHQMPATAATTSGSVGHAQ